MSDGNNKLDVVIIGAGLAGLIAARTLLRAGRTNFLVVEARERIGGRIHCVPLLNTDDFADLGAHFVHGAKGNPLHAFAAESDDILEPPDDDDDDNEDEDLFFTADGQRLNSEATDAFAEKFEEIFEQLTDNEALCNEPNKTVGDLFDETSNRLLRSSHADNKKFDNKLTPSQKKALFQLFSAMECLDSAVDDPRKLSAAGFYDFEDCEGERFTYLKKGFSCVLNRIATDISPSLVRLNTAVNRIDYSTENECSVAVVPKNSEPYILTSRFVLCTVPLGCLKAKTVDFIPSLPSWKQSAIESLGYGTIDRLLFFCERRWWPASVTSYEMFIVWTDESLASFKLKNQNAALYEKPEDMEWYRHLVAFEVEPTISAPILVGYATGHWAQVIEKLPDAEVLAVTGELVTRIIAPHYSGRVKAPVGVLRSKWHADAFSRGSYSHVPVGASSSMFKDLAKPLPSTEKPSLLFAGEATHEKYFSCTHGAWLSGEREAKRILSLL